MRQEKQFILDEIREKIDQSQALIVTRYAKMNPNMANSFRTNLLKTGGDFEVVRKSIFLKAAAEAGCAVDPALLKGFHIGIVFADKDPVQTTKTIYQFRKENEDVLEVLTGRFEGKLCSAQDVEQISKLPGKAELQAQLLGLFEAVPAQLLGTFEALLTSVAHALENKSKT